MTAMIRFAYVMAVRRAVASWRLEAVLFGGILLAVALMASGVIFSDLLANASLRHALREAPPEEANFWMRSFSSQDEPGTVEGRRAVFQERMDFAENRVSQPSGQRPLQQVEMHRFCLAVLILQEKGHGSKGKRDSRPRGKGVKP